MFYYHSAHYWLVIYQENMFYWGKYLEELNLHRQIVSQKSDLKIMQHYKFRDISIHANFLSLMK